MDPYIERHLDRLEGLANTEGTYQKRLSDMKNFDAWLGESQFETATELDALGLEDYFIELKKHGYAPETLAAMYESVRAFYEFLTDKLKEYEITPFDSLKRNDYMDLEESKKLTQGDHVYVTKEEVDQLAENVPSPTTRNELLIRLFFHTGLRCCEMMDVDLADLDREQHSIENVWSNKTKNYRTVYWNPKLDQTMNLWLDYHRPNYTNAEETDALFITPYGRLALDSVPKIVRKAADDAGIQEVMYTDAAGNERRRITPHAFRHGHAVHAVRNCDGIDIRTLQKHMGHKKAKRTMEYLQYADDDVRETMKHFEV